MKRLWPLDQLSAYIDYGRSRVHPTITEAASHELVQSYLKFRSVGDDPRAAEKRITATTRQLESMIRLSSAVELRDVQEAYRLMRDAIRARPDHGQDRLGLAQYRHGSATAQAARGHAEGGPWTPWRVGCRRLARYPLDRCDPAAREPEQHSCGRGRVQGGHQRDGSRGVGEGCRGMREANGQVGGSLSWILGSLMLSCCSSLPHFLCYHHH